MNSSKKKHEFVILPIYESIYVSYKRYSKSSFMKQMKITSLISLSWINTSKELFAKIWIIRHLKKHYKRSYCVRYNFFYLLYYLKFSLVVIVDILIWFLYVWKHNCFAKKNCLSWHFSWKNVINDFYEDGDVFYIVEVRRKAM